MKAWLDGSVVAIRDAVILTVAASVIGLLVNLMHPEKIPFIAEVEYEILVPCPVAGGEVTSIEPDHPDLQSERTFLIDARLKDQYQAWSFRKSLNVPFDYLEPYEDEFIQDLAKRIARSKAQKVVVYGDGDLPDTGEQLGGDLSGKGIKNVFFIKGGAPALKAAQGGGQ